MYTIDTAKFNQTVQRLVGYIIGEQEKGTYDNPTRVDFDSGWLYKEEGYKKVIWNKAQDILKCNEWSLNNLGEYDVINRVDSCMKIKIEPGVQQNLLDYRDGIYYRNTINTQPKYGEQVLYRIYCTTDDEKSFNDAIALFGNRYSLITFLFFLKNSSSNFSENIRYLPVRPNNMATRFQKLGIQTECTSLCTWEHYQEYLQIIAKVQERLKEQLGLEGDLIDAHSFVWALWLLDKSNLQESELSQQLECIDADTAPIKEGSVRLSVVKTRVNQSIFREYLLKKYPHCCLCNVKEPSLLVASHIKPWSVSDKIEKLDIDNGFLLCPNHDQLFDQGWISFDDTGKILISEGLSQADRCVTNVSENMKIHFPLTAGNRVYLKYHRENIFKG